MTKKRTYKVWTEYDDKTLADLRRKNVSIRHIAGILGRTESSIHNRLAFFKPLDPPEVKKKSWLDWIMGR